MSDRYGYDSTYSNDSVVTSKEMLLTIESAGSLAEEYLIQNVNVRYSRPVRILRELGSAKGYMIKNPPMGMLSCDRVVGKKSIVKLLSGALTNSSGGVTASLKPIGQDSAGASYIMNGCKPAGLDVSFGVGQTVITENFKMQFTSMS